VPLLFGRSERFPALDLIRELGFYDATKWPHHHKLHLKPNAWLVLPVVKSNHLDTRYMVLFPFLMIKIVKKSALFQFFVMWNKRPLTFVNL
jgi:hypothetical protein